jgi:cholesterol transport system auxiliary component
MNIRLSALIASCVFSSSFLVGCAFTKSQPITTYDLGKPSTPSGDVFFKSTVDGAISLRSNPITVADVTSPAWLDGQMMVYRLSYDNDQQPQPYATSRWSMPPAQLFGQRVKTRLAQGGNVVLSDADGAVNIPVLRIEMDDFSQNFANVTQSDVHIAIRASVFKGRNLIAQRSFEQTLPAPPDAAGGARALSQATDLMIHDMATWISALPTKY